VFSITWLPIGTLRRPKASSESRVGKLDKRKMSLAQINTYFDPFRIMYTRIRTLLHTVLSRLLDTYVGCSCAPTIPGTAHVCTWQDMIHTAELRERPGGESPDCALCTPPRPRLLEGMLVAPPRSQTIGIAATYISTNHSAE
jgi:hypothetical protein